MENWAAHICHSAIQATPVPYIWGNWSWRLSLPKHDTYVADQVRRFSLFCANAQFGKIEETIALMKGKVQVIDREITWVFSPPRENPGFLSTKRKPGFSRENPGFLSN